MKTASSFIWQLIQAMSSQEKNFFRKNTGNGRPGSPLLYLRLFDAIARQKEYDEAALLKKFGPAISSKNIAYQKHYLQKQICSALTEYEAQKNKGVDVYENLQLIRIFRQKGLYDEALSLWKKTVETARSKEAFALLNLLKSEFEKMIIISHSQTDYDELLQVFMQNIISYQEYAGLITLRDIYTEILLLKKKTHLDEEPVMRNELEKLMQAVENEDMGRQGQSFLMRHYYDMSKATLLYMMNKPAECLLLLKTRMDDWRNNERFLQTHGEFYIELFYMINYAGILQRDFSYVEEVFNNRFNQLITDPTHRAYFEVIRFLALHKLYNKTARYSEVQKLLTQAKKKYTEWEPRLNAELCSTLHFSMGVGCFVLEDYADALFHTHQAITRYPDSILEENIAVGQLLLMLITYCMDNDRLFESQYRNTYTYFYKRKKKQSFEKVIIQCLHRNFNNTDKQKKLDEYRKALTQLESTSGNLLQQRVFNVFNFPGWLQSRISRISYRQYVEQQVKKGSGANA